MCDEQLVQIGKVGNDRLRVTVLYHIREKEEKTENFLKQHGGTHVGVGGLFSDEGSKKKEDLMPSWGWKEPRFIEEGFAEMTLGDHEKKGRTGNVLQGRGGPERLGGRAEMERDRGAKGGKDVFF